MSNPIKENVVDPLLLFASDSKALINKCHKPDTSEFVKVARATFMGFLILGGLGFIIKLVHIPINNIILVSQ